MDNFAELLGVFKALLGIEGPSTARDAELTAYLNGSIAACEKYMDDVINRRSVTQLWTEAITPIPLRYSFASGLTQVMYEGADEVDEWELISNDATSFLRRKDETAIVLLSKELSATYTAGYVTCPYDLMVAICYGAAALEGQKGAGMAAPGSAVKKEMVTGVGTVEYDLSSSMGGTASVGFLPPQTIQILDLYRRVGV